MRAPIALSLAAALGLVASPALAIDEFPGMIAVDLKLAYDPPCGVCHEFHKTGGGTVHTPFGYAMRARGLSADDRGSLATALAKMQAEHVDSDGDGVPDTDELVAGTDPNSPAAASIANGNAADPKLGCGGQSSVANRPVDVVGAALALATATAFAWRRKKTNRKGGAR